MTVPQSKLLVNQVIILRIIMGNFTRRCHTVHMMTSSRHADYDVVVCTCQWCGYVVVVIGAMTSSLAKCTDNIMPHDDEVIVGMVGRRCRRHGDDNVVLAHQCSTVSFSDPPTPGCIKTTINA